MADYDVQLPDDFDREAWQVEAKGWLPGVLVVVGARRYRLTFYDPVRLAQTIEDDLRAGPLFFEKNLVVVPRVTRAHVESAIRRIVTEGRHRELAPEREPNE